MDLILMPIVVSLLGIGLFAIPILIGGAMLFGQTTAPIGKRVLIYSACSLLVGLACCWTGFGLMLLLGSLERHSLQLGNVNISLPVAIFWASVPTGIVLDAILAHRLLENQR